MELTFNGQIEPGYIKEVKDILENREFMQLGAFSHHQSTSRLMHSINVSYISWHIARKLGCDARMAARAGLLHDFCLYDFREKPPTGGFQAFDGFYGPGTGTFLILVFTGLLKLGTRDAAGISKVVNLSADIGALGTFFVGGKVDYALGIAAALFCMAGSYFGAGLVVNNGQKIVRPVVMGVLALLFVKILAG